MPTRIEDTMNITGNSPVRQQTLPRRRRPLQFLQPDHRLPAVVPAHLDGRLQATAKRRPLGLAEHAAAIVVVELHATHAGRLGGKYLKR